MTNNTQNSQAACALMASGPLGLKQTAPSRKNHERRTLTLGWANRLLASTALVVCLLHAAPARADVLVKETVTETPGTTTIKKTVTETAPDSTSVHTTVTTESPATTKTETHWSTEEHSVSATGVRLINFVEFDLNKDGILSI